LGESKFARAPSKFGFSPSSVPPCNSRAEAHLKERRVIEELKPTLNENIPCRSYRELREKNKEQYNAYMREYMKKYYQRKKKEKEGEYKQTPFNDTICWD